MFKAVCELESTSPLSFGRRYEDKAPKDEDPGEHDRATWRERLHVDENGECFIPSSFFKGALQNGVKIMAEKIKGKGNNTYNARFKAGVVVENDVLLGIKPKDVGYEDVYVPSDGKSGGSSPQVLKRFPKIPDWKGRISVLVLIDEIITQEVFKRYLKLAGLVAGIGRYRPERGGRYGRFDVKSIKFEKIEI